MRVAVLDLATHLGFCFGTEAGVIEHGSHKLPSTGSDIGTFLASYRSWLVGFLKRTQAQEVVFEMPILPAKGNLATLRKLYSLAGITELIAADAGCNCSEANLFDIRGHFVGVRVAPREIKGTEHRRRWWKDRVVTEVRRCGFRPADDNAADAMALFSFVMASRVPGFVLAGDEIPRAA